MPETFAIVLDENMANLDKLFACLDERKTYDLRTRPDGARFGSGRALIISQDSHNVVFAAVGYLSGTTLVGETLRFEAVSRFTIPVVLESATGESSALVLGKGYMNRFMYLAPDAADAVIGEAERLRTAAFRPAHGPPERLPPARRRSTGRTRRRNGTRCWRHPS